MKKKSGGNKSFFTKATDSLGAVTSGVDPRTGIYSVHLTLGNIKTNKGLGPDFDLLLRYFPLSAENHGFGKGFSIGLTTYNRGAKVLNLYTGENYKVYDSNNNNDEARVLGLKNHSFKFKKINDNEYVIIYKDGKKEYLRGAGDGSDIKTTYKIVSHSGQELCLEWDYSWARGVRLISVHNKGDTPGSLINIEYVEDSKSTVHFFRDTEEAYDIELTFFNNYLTTMKSFAISKAVQENSVQEWTFSYTDSRDGAIFKTWGNWLNKVVYPSGMTEMATYNHSNGHAFPSNAYLPDLPYVNTFERFLDKNMRFLANKSKFQYSKENFLGGNTNYNWGPDGVDENGLEYIFTLWNLNPNYSYSCTEYRHCDNAGNQSVIITSVYNIFHLLISEEIKDENGSIKNNIEYYASTHLNPVSQSANLMMPKKHLQNLKNRAGKNITLCTDTQYDEHANLIARTVKHQDNGTIVEPSVNISYYSGADDSSQSENGIDLFCPADPDGFVKFIKCVTISPVSTKKNEEDKVLYFCYKDIGNGVIEKIRESQINSLNTITTSFFYDSDLENSGRLTGEEYVLTRGNKKYKNLTTYNYINEARSFTKHTTFVSYDNKKITSDTTISNHTGRTLKEINQSGMITEYAYDYTGRVTNKVTKTSDSDDIVDNYVYTLNPEDTYPLKTLHIRPDGVQILHEHDAIARIIQIRIDTVNEDTGFYSNWPVTEKYEYDFIGRKSKATALDYFWDGKNHKKIMEKTVCYKYDIWGNECERKTNAGLVENIEFDPATLTNTYTFRDVNGNPVLGDIIEKINHLGSQLQTMHVSFDKKEVNTSVIERDGWNRTVKKINTYGGEFFQDYDCYDRIIAETRYDANKLIYNYADFTIENFIETFEIEINSDHTDNGKNIIQTPPVRTIIGKKRYDGLGRLTENKAFSRRWSYEYDADISTAPRKIIDPNGVVKIVDYSNISGQKVKNVFINEGTTKHVIQQFKYNKITGAMLEGIESRCSVKRDYNKYGFLERDSLSFDATSSKSIEYKWSLCGLLYSIKDASGYTQENCFDELGRVVQVKGNKVDILYKYDELSRVILQTVSMKDNSHQIETTIRYDGFGRECYRKVHDTLHTNNTRVLKQSWDKLNRLVQKEIYLINNEQEIKIITEDYTYNPNGSISSYDCIQHHEVGLEHIPTDNYGNKIFHESYEYDAFGNVIKNTRNFSPLQGDQSSTKHLNIAIFVYDTIECTRLVEVTNTHQNYPSVLKFKYSLNGNMTDTGKHIISYDEVGRITKINDKPYIYDALDRMVKAGDKERLFAFRHLRSETGDEISHTHLFVGHQGAELHNNEVILTACDGKNSCIYAANSSRGEWQTYTVYGESNLSHESLSFMGFNGEHRDNILNVYGPGAGSRLYSPALMRFITADSPFNSPFGAAGLNPYTYCLGDPVNNADPTGQISWQGWMGMMAGGIGLMMTLITGGLSIVAASGVLATSLAVGATAASLVSGVTAIVGTAISGISPDATRILRWVSLGTGLLSFSSGVAGMAQGVYKAMRELGLRTTLATMGFTSRVGLALNTISYATATVSYGISLTKRVLDHTSLAKSRLSTLLGHIGFGAGLISDAASISHFTLSKAMPRSFSWDVPKSTTMDEISLRSLTPGGNSLDANVPGSYAHYSEVFIPQINNFFLHIPLQARM